jgi:hypothetical protein
MQFDMLLSVLVSKHVLGFCCLRKNQKKAKASSVFIDIEKNAGIKGDGLLKSNELRDSMY